MRVLLITDALPPQPRGGLDLHLRELETELHTRGVDVYLEPLAGDAPDAIGSGGPPGSRLRRSYANGPMCATFDRLLDDIRPDVVHFHSLRGLHYLLPDQARRVGARVLWTHHDFFAICQRLHLLNDQRRHCDGPDGGRACGRCFGGMLRLFGPTLLPLRTTALVRSMAACHAHVVPSEFVAGLLIDGGANALNVHILPPAVPAPRRLATRPDAGPHRLLFLGDLRVDKGADLALAATRLLGERVRLEIHGGPPAPPASRDKAFEALLAREATDAPVRLCGPYAPSELPGILDGAAAVIVPSRVRETFGRTANEALLAGVPVVAADDGALPEQVVDGGNGALFVPADAPSLADAIRRVLDADPPLEARSPDWPEPPDLGDHTDELLRLYGGDGP